MAVIGGSDLPRSRRVITDVGILPSSINPSNGENKKRVSFLMFGMGE